MTQQIISRRLANKMKFASRAASYGAKGGSASTDKKKAACALSLAKAREALAAKRAAAS